MGLARRGQMTHRGHDLKLVTFTVDVGPEPVPLRAYCIVCDAEICGRGTLEFQLRAHARVHQ